VGIGKMKGKEVILIFCGVVPHTGIHFLKKCKRKQIKTGKFKKDSL